MRFALLFVALVGCTTSTPHPDMCPNCNPPVCPSPFEVVPDAVCSVVPLVCPTPCGMKCQCWPDDAGVTVWKSTTPCEGGTEDADAADAGVDADATDAASDASDAD